MNQLIIIHLAKKNTKTASRNLAKAFSQDAMAAWSETSTNKQQVVDRILEIEMEVLLDSRVNSVF